MLFAGGAGERGLLGLGKFGAKLGAVGPSVLIRGINFGNTISRKEDKFKRGCRPSVLISGIIFGKFVQVRKVVP